MAKFEEIAEIIKKEGSIPFSRYMELSMSREFAFELKFSSEFMDYLAKTIANCLNEMVEICGGSIYDFGMTSSRLLKRLTKLVNAEYYLVESAFNKPDKIPPGVRVCKFDEVESCEGVILISRILSALPSHILLSNKQVFVDFKNGRFEEKIEDIDKSLFDEFSDVLEKIDPSKKVYLSIEALKLIQQLCKKLSTGFMVITDYMSEELCDAITCYDETVHTHDPYASPGKMRMRIPLNIPIVANVARKMGLEVFGLTNYMHIMKSTLGLVEEFSDEIKKLTSVYKDPKLGSVKVMILKKNIDVKELNCLKWIPNFGYWKKYNYPHPEELEVLPEG
ncbi:hypothetical protein Asulf_02105 [Archaeoglobus sulfaticallidus PM70-1]|uniref:Uncharacterized protein n=1 Tax=Archaeoglobus sulfaticallidus PM70-1 TaxID=387631 RepID=N0BGE8_9EURY|nr:SAM-dependent methyltransferase [Archaeoglobus sulfaticallidus]AGK62063.1 hypothetical protein Asulf_02105 [Archaeoglobus sulfaticallidus PM70-1]